MMPCTNACSGEASGPRSATLAAVSSPSEGVRAAEVAGGAEVGAGSTEVRHSSVSAACLHKTLPHVSCHVKLLHILCICPWTRWPEQLHLFQAQTPYEMVSS